jgi:hypothetical protein
MNETPLINRAKVKSLALHAAQQRARKFTRVGGDFYLKANAALSNFVVHYVANHPSVGVTIK